MPFTHILHPEITKIKQVNIDGVRYYDTPDGTLISITSLLKNFTPEGILQWRKSVGEIMSCVLQKFVEIKSIK